MWNITIIISAAGLMPVVLYYEQKENRKGLLPAKTLLSMLFVVAIFVQPYAIFSYYFFLLSGLIICLLGDVCLVFSQRRMFLCGLIFFLLGHVLYILGFYTAVEISLATGVGAVFIFVVGGRIYGWFKPYLGPMKPAVFIYTVVISIMLVCAGSVLLNSALAPAGRIMAFGGALCFYISDIFVARDRFLKRDFFNRLVGLPLYYGGQFLLAFSVRFLG